MADTNRRRRHRSLFIDSLESRQHLHANVDLTWAFSPTNPSTSKEIADHGGVYKKYGNYTFGWSSNERDETRTRNAVSNKRLDSFIHVKSKWELALPNGLYKVTLTSGDAKHTDSLHVIDVEGVRIMNGSTSSKNLFRVESDIVNVKDGKLTLRPGSMGRNVKLNSIRIESTHSETPATVSMAVVRNEAREQPTSDAQNGLIRITRKDGDTAEPLVVKLEWSGSAGSKDLVSRPGSVTIPAGVLSLDVAVVAKTDSLNEKAETAVIKLVSNGSAYNVGSPNSASIRVANTNSPTVNRPVITIGATNPTATEGGSNGLIQLSRSGDVSQALAVQLVWSGSAGSADISSRPETVLFSAGSNTANLVVEAIDDLLVEANETATVTVQASSLYTIGGSASASVTVVSDDVDEPEADRNSISWANASAAPDGATEAQTAVVNNLFYRFGGYRDNSFVPSRKVERLDPSTGVWTSRTEMPIGFTHSAVAVVGTKVWFAGAYEERVGVAGQQNIGTVKVLVYDTVANSWSNGPDLPDPRGSGGMEHIDGKLYFTSGERLSDRAVMPTTWMLDLANQGAGWQTRADMPSPRSHFGTATVDGIMYVLGGQTGAGANGVPLKTVYAYNPATNTWTQKADLPRALSHQAPATVVFEDKIYGFGGDNPADIAQAYVMEYDPATGTSRTLASLPAARMAGLAGVINDDQFIFHGGYDWDFRATTWIATWS